MLGAGGSQTRFDIVVQLNPSGEGFNLGLADFSAQARLDQELTGMSGLLLCAIERLAGGGGTNLESAIDVAVQELTSLRNREDISHPNTIIIITDGNTNAQSGRRIERILEQTEAIPHSTKMPA